MGQLDNTIVVFTTDNGAETITFPDGGVTPFKGGKLSTWEGGMRGSVRHPLAGGHQAGHDLHGDVRVARLAADVRGDRRADRRATRLNDQIKAAYIPASSRSKLDGHNQIDYLDRASRQKAATRHVLLLLLRFAARRRCATRTGRFTYAMVVRPARLASIAGTLTLCTGPRSSTSCAIRSRPRVGQQYEDPAWATGGALAAPGRRRTSTTGTCCPWGRPCGSRNCDVPTWSSRRCRARPATTSSQVLRRKMKTAEECPRDSNRRAGAHR